MRKLVAHVKDTNKVKPQPIDMIPPSSDWKQLKLWNGELLPNHYCSFAGQITFIKNDKMSYLKIGSPNTCFSVKIMGLKLDARKVVWRTFTDIEPQYSQEHYRVHTISTNGDKTLRFDNLKMLVEGSIFDQWLKEDEVWPWTRSPKGTLPPNCREKKYNSTNRRTKPKEGRGKRCTPGQIKSCRTQRKQTDSQKPVIHSAAAQASKPSPPAFKKTAAPVKQVVVKKHIRKISERAFQDLKKKVEMNIKISSKERQNYLEQKTLRKLDIYLKVT